MTTTLLIAVAMVILLVAFLLSARDRDEQDRLSADLAQSTEALAVSQAHMAAMRDQAAKIERERVEKAADALRRHNAESQPY